MLAAAAAAAAAARLVDASWSALTTAQFAAVSAANQYELRRDADAGLCRSTAVQVGRLISRSVQFRVI